LTIHGDGYQSRDFVHVEDVAEALVAASERDSAEGQVLNIGSGKPTSINELAQTVLNICGASERIVYTEPRVGDIRNSFADITKAQKLIAFKPSHALEDGLHTLVPQLLKMPTNGAFSNQKRK
jgi:UDP-glucose 4-epimerase